jgi:regulator of protease activity HflC (stomatin/prohibitin superfamily)
MPQFWFLFLVVVFVLASAIKILREWERGVVLRLGRFQAVRGPGITFVIPLLERMYRAIRPWSRLTCPRKTSLRKTMSPSASMPWSSFAS